MTGQLDISLIESHKFEGGRRQEDTYRITNNGSSAVDTHLLVIALGLPDRIDMENASGTTSTGNPYLRVFLHDGALLPGQTIVRSLRFERRAHAPQVSYTLTLLSGQGQP